MESTSAEGSKSKRGPQGEKVKKMTVAMRALKDIIMVSLLIWLILFFMLEFPHKFSQDVKWTEEIENTPVQLFFRLKKLEGQLTINLPCPPTDRLWLSIHSLDVGH